VLCLASLLVPWLGHRQLMEKSLRLSTHAASLDRFALDALLGATAVRVHGAERSLQNAREALLCEWAKTADELHGRQTLVSAARAITTTAAAAALIIGYLEHAGSIAGLLALAFLTLRVPAVAEELMGALAAVRDLKVLALRVLAPLSAPAADMGSPEPAPAPVAGMLREPLPAREESASRSRGARLSLENVSVVAGGHRLLERVSLEVAAGEHVAIVGASGAGKSSLLGLMLGFLRASEGIVRVDDRALDAEEVRALREQVAWVDPAVQLWDRSLFDNLCYADDRDVEEMLPRALSSAELLEVLPRLPAGLQTGLGENGGRVSGGQGQRIRIGRALMRRTPRLVLLDEPFRGLQRTHRRALLSRLRAAWAGSTLLFVSHDVDDTIHFERVVVIEAGRIVEAGDPRRLLEIPDGRYAALHRSAKTLTSEVWRNGTFRRITLVDGSIVRSDEGAVAEQESS
jgi:ATP-binding cassette subfamily B protein